MIVIEVTRQAYQSRSTSSGTFNDQSVLIHGVMVNGFPAEVPRQATVSLDQQNPQPYPPGKYVISDESFYFGKYDSLALGRMRLRPLSDFLKELQVQFSQQKAA